ncbi:MAG: 4Fe-4S binding protein [Desulfovibrio sp.]|nr:4Fe-4S binding protein [Desulfovibrio sp.]
MQEHVQVESSKCKACRRCEVACIASHHGLDFKTAMKQKALYSPRCWAVKGDDYKTSVRCHGCNPAPCCNICPTGALTQNKDGSFTIHLELCAGCMMCMSVCPYGVIAPEVMAKEENAENLPVKAKQKPIAVRCDLCHDWRIEKGVEYTACMEACMTRALTLVKRDGTIVEAPQPEKKAPQKAVEPAAEKKSPELTESAAQKEPTLKQPEAPDASKAKEKEPEQASESISPEEGTSAKNDDVAAPASLASDKKNKKGKKKK